MTTVMLPEEFWKIGVSFCMGDLESTVGAVGKQSGGIRNAFFVQG